LASAFCLRRSCFLARVHACGRSLRGFSSGIKKDRPFVAALVVEATRTCAASLRIPASIEVSKGLSMATTSRIAIVGAGNVGATAAYALMLRGLFAEIVLIDHVAERAAAEATDIADANAIAQPVRIWPAITLTSKTPASSSSPQVPQPRPVSRAPQSRARARSSYGIAFAKPWMQVSTASLSSRPTRPTR
jgi:hypothetical protein